MKYRKLKNFLRSTAFACALCLMCGIIGTASDVHPSAETQAELEQKIKENQEYIDELEKKIANTEGSIAENEELSATYYAKMVAQQDGINLLNNKLYAKEQEILAKEEEIAGVEVDIADTEKRIEDKKVEIASLDAQNKDNIYRFGQIIRTMYINDTDDVFSILVGSADFYDIFVRTEMLESATQQNYDFMNRLLDDIHRLDEEKLQLEKDVAQLEDAKAELEKEKQDLEDERTALDEEKSYANKLAAQYTEEYNSYETQIANLEYLKATYAEEKRVSLAEIEAYEKKIDEIIRQAQLAASNSVVYDQGEWQWPLDPRFTLITTYFGYDAWRGGNHGAIDIGNGGINGANIYAMKGGEVIVAKTTYTAGYDYGMYVVIDHGDGYQSLYAHCSAIYVTVGQMVNKGDTIAAVGSTGFSTGPHLHFEIRKDGSRVDPLQYVNVP